MSERYTAVAMVLHWLIAIGILALIGVGLAMTHLTLAPMLQFQLYQLHKSIGITVLLGVLLRICGRSSTHRPRCPRCRGWKRPRPRARIRCSTS